MIINKHIKTFLNRAVVPKGCHDISQSFAQSVTLGADTGNSGGDSIDPDGSADTKGSYDKITSSLSVGIKALMVCIGSSINNARQFCSWNLDIAVGPAGSEVVIIPDLYLCVFGGTDNHRVSPPFIGPFPVSIPAGGRVAARAKCNITDSTDRVFDLVLIGLY